MRRGVERLEPGSVLVLENTRWERGETENDPALAEELASLADAYVNDAFGAAHRAHASTAGVAEYVRPAVAGLLLEREVTTLRAIVDAPERPLVVVLGGAKVTDKIALIDRFLDTADTLLIGGAMCFSFFRAQGKPTGDSLVEEEGVELARRALEKAESSDCRLLLPLDLVLGDRFDAGAERRVQEGVEVPDGWMGLDVGPRTAEAYAEEIARAGTVFWNGPMGAFELEPFAGGTRDRGRGRGPRAGHDRGGRRRLRRRAGRVRPGRRGGPPLHRRRRRARAAGGQGAARAWRRSTMNERRPFIAGNWKLWGTRAQAARVLRAAARAAARRGPPARRRGPVRAVHRARRVRGAPRGQRGRRSSPRT